MPRVSKSRISAAKDIHTFAEAEFDIVLIGEAFMYSLYTRGATQGIKNLTLMKICGLTRTEDIMTANALRPEIVSLCFTSRARGMSPKR